MNVKNPPLLSLPMKPVAPKQSVKKGEQGIPPQEATPLPNMWTKEALLTKAQRYAEEMNQHARDDWRFGLWSSLALEALARAALAKVSPVLLAENGKDSWDHLYYALGHAPKKQKFIPKSIDISGVFSRLAEIFPQFDARLAGTCVLHISRRNEDLHSGGTPFDSIQPASWQPQFYEACDVLMKSMDSTLTDLVGEAEAKVALALVAAAKDKSAQAVAQSVHAHKTVWEQKPEGERQKVAAQAAVWATKQSGHRVSCPSCNSDALVVGGPTAPAVVKLKDDQVIEVQEFLPSKFECVACGLKISGLAQLHACGLGNPYKSTSTYDPFEYYAEQGGWSEYEPDNND